MKDIGDINAIGISFYNLASVYSAQDKFSDSAKLYQKALNIFERIGDSNAIGLVTRQLGIMFQKSGDYGQTESLYRKALEINEQSGNVQDDIKIVFGINLLSE